jgi:DNA-binding beta-propeller fold protein YncE
LIRFVLLSLSGLACFATTYTIQTVAGASNAGDGGSALSAALGQPEGVAIDIEGNVYVADAAANRVRIIAPDGTIQTFAGTGVAGFSTEISTSPIWETAGCAKSPSPA